MEFVVVGAGAIGGTVGARLLREGHDVLFCDVDGEHVAVTFARATAGSAAKAALPLPAL